jgi:hypothetical protein
MQAAKEGAILDEAPRQHAVEVFTHGERADRYAQLEVVERERGPAREIAFPEQGVRVEIAKVEREHLVEQLVGLGVRSRLDTLLGIEKEIGSRVVARGCDLRQPVHRAPISDCFATSGLSGRFVLTVQGERDESEHGCVDPNRRHLAREIRVPSVRPLFLRRHGDDRARDLVAHRRAERDNAGRTDEAATQCVRLAREHHEVDRLTDDDVVDLDLVRPRNLGPRRRERREAKQRAVARYEGCAGAASRKHHVRETQLVRELAAPAGREEAHAR